MGESTLNDLPTVSAVIIVGGRIVSSNKKYRPPVSDFFKSVQLLKRTSQSGFSRLEGFFFFRSGIRKRKVVKDAPATRVRRVRIEASLWHYAEI